MKKLIIATLIAASVGLPSLPASAATRAEIAATVTAVCAGGGDCGAAVTAAIALATTPEMAAAIGQGLADAVAQVSASNPDLATSMLVAIANAPTSVQTAYQYTVDVATASTAPVEPTTPAQQAATPGSPN